MQMLLRSFVRKPSMSISSSKRNMGMGESLSFNSTISMMGMGRRSTGRTLSDRNSSAFSRTCGHVSRGGWIRVKSLIPALALPDFFDKVFQFFPGRFFTAKSSKKNGKFLDDRLVVHQLRRDEAYAGKIEERVPFVRIFAQLEGCSDFLKHFLALRWRQQPPLDLAPVARIHVH